jgi:predicted SnoaL-like aldol condensation-catalyzing enzyme
MKIIFCLTLLCLFMSRGVAQQAFMLKSNDPHLVKNKKLVYDFWRNVFEGGHLDEASIYMTESYIQHNPNVPTGRKAFVDFFSKYAVAKPVVDTIQANLIVIIDEKDLVTLVFSQQHPDPKDSSQKYSTTWFDMFRIENGKIAEHWDPALKQ